MGEALELLPRSEEREDHGLCPWESIYQIEARGKIKVDPKETSEAKWFDINNLPPKADFAFDHFEIIRDFLRK